MVELEAVRNISLMPNIQPSFLDSAVPGDGHLVLASLPFFSAVVDNPSLSLMSVDN